ncbi:hypothetical protein EV421DRAFT_1852145 [Armillaria borealis]|uniref:Uncharacterized protein n=1 Tax=Armillaria borealis TaxID=47425 RepID=A0AA39IXR9_9AGAR|nr:hypothetical protein EV421DRAFT_1852145 [Armillaria borealis]
MNSFPERSYPMLPHRFCAPLPPFTCVSILLDLFLFFSWRLGDPVFSAKRTFLMISDCTFSSIAPISPHALNLSWKPMCSQGVTPGQLTSSSPCTFITRSENAVFSMLSTR